MSSRCHFRTGMCFTECFRSFTEKKRTKTYFSWRDRYIRYTFESNAFRKTHDDEESEPSRSWESPTRQQSIVDGCRLYHAIFGSCHTTLGPGYGRTHPRLVIWMGNDLERHWPSHR